MGQIHIVSVREGWYDDRDVRMVKAFSDKQAAQKFAERAEKLLDELYKKYGKFQNIPAGLKLLDPHVTAESHDYGVTTIDAE